MTSAHRAASFVVSAFSDILNTPSLDVIRIGDSRALPRFQQPCLIDLCSEAISHFMERPMLVTRTESVYIVGDLHGSFHDLVRILRTCDYQHSKFVFLGDYVDRGQFSLEVITLLLALAITRPGQFTLLRGNHEFRDVCEKYGFKEELSYVYGDDTIFLRFCEVFEYMPVACLLDGEHLCVHGGISQRLVNLYDIMAIPRPLKNGSAASFVMDLLWADPTEQISDYSESARSADYHNFGEGAFRRFLKKFSLKSVVRAHEYTPSGVKIQFNSLITVFSASSYASHASNKCGLVYYNADRKAFEYHVFDPLPRMGRKAALFFTPKYEMRQPSPTKTPIKLHCCSMISHHQSTTMIPKSIFSSRSSFSTEGGMSSATSCPSLAMKTSARKTHTFMKTFYTCRVAPPAARDV